VTRRREEGIQRGGKKGGGFRGFRGKRVIGGVGREGKFSKTGRKAKTLIRRVDVGEEVRGKVCGKI